MKRKIVYFLSILLVVGMVIQPSFAQNSEIKLYYYDLNTFELVYENRVIEHSPEAALTELLKGPTNKKFFLPFPQGVQLINITYNKDVVIINLTQELLKANDPLIYKTVMIVEVIGNVLKQFDEIKKFTIVVEGKQIGELGDVNFNEIYTTDVENEYFDLEGIQPKSIPDVPHLKLVIDPGHGGADSGAYNHQIGPSGLLEKNAVLDIGLKLRDYMSYLDATVYMTRSTDTAMSNTQRINYANSTGADLFVTIHNNSQADPNTGQQLHTANGIETWWRKSIDQSFAGTVHNHAKQAYFGPFYGYFHDRTLKQGAYTILGVSMRAALVEAGFISNTDKDYQILNNSSHRSQIAYSICLGIRKYWWGY